MFERDENFQHCSSLPQHTSQVQCSLVLLVSDFSAASSSPILNLVCSETSFEQDLSRSGGWMDMSWDMGATTVSKRGAPKTCAAAVHTVKLAFALVLVLGLGSNSSRLRAARARCVTEQQRSYSMLSHHTVAEWRLLAHVVHAQLQSTRFGIIAFVSRLGACA